MMEIAVGLCYRYSYSESEGNFQFLDLHCELSYALN